MTESCRQKWKNFSIWRGRLPHWRADGVTYYVTFRHRRPLMEDELAVLFHEFMKLPMNTWNLDVLCVLPSSTELLVRMGEPGPRGRVELSKVIEKAKARAGRRIIRVALEKFPPFYEESFDRIVRDEAEFTEKLESILNSPDREGISPQADPYPFIHVVAEPTFTDQ